MGRAIKSASKRADRQSAAGRRLYAPIASVSCSMLAVGPPCSQSLTFCQPHQALQDRPETKGRTAHPGKRFRAARPDIRFRFAYSRRRCRLFSRSCPTGRLKTSFEVDGANSCESTIDSDSDCLHVERGGRAERASVSTCTDSHVRRVRELLCRQRECSLRNAYTERSFSFLAVASKLAKKCDCEKSAREHLHCTSMMTSLAVDRSNE